MTLPAVLIPLHGRSGAVRGYAVVDTEAAERLNQRRWQLSNMGYALRSQLVEGRPRAVMMHREVVGLPIDDLREVDHLNGDPLDNRRLNLAIVTHQENLGNQKAQEGRASRFRGVQRFNGKWVAKVKMGGKTRQLGTFATEEAADQAVREWWGNQLSHLPGGRPPTISRDSLPVITPPAKNAHARRSANPADQIEGDDDLGPYIGIPLYDRHGLVCGHALVDPSDAGLLMQWRWCCAHAGRSYQYAVRSQLVDGVWKHISMQREILGLPRFERGTWGGYLNGNTLDNRRKNLVAKTPRESALTRRSR